MSIGGSDPVAGASDGGLASGPGQVLGRGRSGCQDEDAAVEAGVSSPVAFRWFRHAGRVNPGLAPMVSGRYLSSNEREDIALWRTTSHLTAVCEEHRHLQSYASTGDFA